MKFNELNLIPEILDAVNSLGYETPTPIQERAIPKALKGQDVLGCAQTGTGKTAAFSIPILQILNESHGNKGGRRPIRSLILTPTRELAAQIGESIRDYSQNLQINYAVIYGGVKQGTQVDKLRRGVDILVATPGRLIDLMDQGYVKLHDVEIFVLDEADRMLDMGFIHDIKRILPKLPTKRQTLFFSATMPPAIVELTKKLLVNPAHISVNPVSSAAQTVRQVVYHVLKPTKKQLLLHLLKDSTMDSVLIFVRTKRGADRLARILAKANIVSAAIHGDKSQNQREKALKGFKSGRNRVLVATDIAARGIDIEDLTYVVNYDIPNEPETYVHRIGRTGRAGASGNSISLCDIDEKPFIKDIEKLIGKKIEVIEGHPFPITQDAINDYREMQDGFTKQNEIQMQKRREARAHRKTSGGAGNGKRKGGNRRR